MAKEQLLPILTSQVQPWLELTTFRMLNKSTITRLLQPVPSILWNIKLKVIVVFLIYE
jgi:hypothetical protein